MIKENHIQTAEDIQSSLKELFTLQEMFEAERRQIAHTFARQK